MKKNTGLAVLGGIVGLAFFAVGYIYATHNAGNLPAFFPGYTSGSDHVHYKHSIAAFIAGVGCLIFAWFQSGPKTSA